jgi:DUF971 family protein
VNAQPPETPFPASIDLIRGENALEITWEDGALTRYDGRQLRWACPCAECRGELGSPGRLDRPVELSADEESLDQVGLIGQYALQITFRSGHGTGLYTFSHLRRLADAGARSSG